MVHIGTLILQQAICTGTLILQQVVHRGALILQQTVPSLYEPWSYSSWYIQLPPVFQKLTPLRRCTVVDLARYHHHVTSRGVLCLLLHSCRIYMRLVCFLWDPQASSGNVSAFAAPRTAYSWCGTSCSSSSSRTPCCPFRCEPAWPWAAARLRSTCCTRWAARSQTPHRWGGIIQRPPFVLPQVFFSLHHVLVTINVAYRLTCPVLTMSTY